MPDICTACVGADKTVFFIGDTEFYSIYAQILKEISVYNISAKSVRVCSECRTMLESFHHFKQQVKESYIRLLQTQNLDSTKINRETDKLYIGEVKNEFDNMSIDINDEINVENSEIDKYNVDIVKSEGLEVEEHHEPETFVNNLSLEEMRGSREGDKVTKRKKKVKPVKGKMQKVKKVHIKENLSDGASDISSLGNTEDNFLIVTKGKKLKGKVVKETTGDNISDVDTLTSSEDVLINIKRGKKGKILDELIKETLSDCVSDAESLEYAEESILNVKKGKEPRKKKGKIGKRKKCNGTIEMESISNGVVEKIEVETKEREKDFEIEKEGVEEELVIKPKVKEVLAEKPQCVECGKIFSSKKTYRYHMNVIHKGQNRYPCPRCGKVYQWKSNLGRHLRSHKARDTGELYCETCDKRFASVATYRQHLKISRRHISESDFNFMCNQCGKKFVNKTRLRDHIDWEHLHNIKFRCAQCNKPFKCHTSLYVHLQNVHRNKEKKDNLCHVCGKSYQNAAKLKYHIVAMHTSETPYQCGQCAAAFGWYSSLYRHVREVHYKVPKKPKKSKKSELSSAMVMHLPQMP